MRLNVKNGASDEPGINFPPITASKHATTPKIVASLIPLPGRIFTSRRP